MRSIEAGIERKPDGIKAVIFDWDGVLAATMEGNYRAWTEAFAPDGGCIPRQAYFLLEGMPALDVARHFLLANGQDPSRAGEVRKRKEEYYLRHCPLVLYPAAADCIARLRAGGMALALVSGAGRARLSGSGAVASLAGFRIVVTGDDVKNGKPHPEPYLKALQGLELKPEECLVVENAPLGIHAAKQAGIPVVALTTTLPAENLAEADWILDGLDGFMDWLDRHRVLGAIERKQA